MPKIPQYQQQSTAQATLSPRTLDTGGQDVVRGLAVIGAGAERMGRSLKYVQEVEQRKAVADDLSATHLAMTKAGAHWSQYATETKVNAEGDPAGTWGRMGGEFKKYSGDLLATAKTPEGRAYLEGEIAKLEGQLASTMIPWEAERGIKFRAIQFQDSFDPAAVTVRADPSLYGTTLEQQAAVLSRINVPGDVRDELFVEMKGTIAAAAVETLMDRDPHAMKKALASKPGESGIEAVEGLSNKARERALDMVTMKIDRAEAKAEAAAARAEARGDRVLGEIDRQLASGIPATPQMWADWQRRVSGTPSAASFDDRVKAEAQVQSVLRLPVADQITFAQAAEARLMSQGGTPQEAANIGRLNSAIQSNVKTLQTTPLVFYQNRTGTEVAPLDLSLLAGADEPTAFTEAIRDRIDTVSGLRKSYGAQVPLKPLLPQEVEQLGAIVAASSPEQATGLYARLRQAAGSDQAYQAIMGQIAPSAPLRSLAGMLAAKQRTTTLDRNLIADDVVANSTDVANTLLQGEKILSSKDDAGPKKLYLPEVTTLQDTFTNQVGVAFAGRPGAANIAFQAVQAYYVGKAQQTGRLARDGQDVDAQLVREAVNAVLGSVVDYNGGGEVIAPWGMSEDDFSEKATAAIQARLPEKDWDRIDSLGLRNYKGDQFYVTQGRSFVLNPAGQPILINLGDP